MSHSYTKEDVPKIVFDTNIYISAFFWKGASYQLLQQMFVGNFHIFISPHIIEEITRVLKRDFSLPEKKIIDYLTLITSTATVVTPKEIPLLVKDDPDDDHIIACAYESKSLLIITQDKHLLKLQTPLLINIFHPDDFLKKRLL